MATESASSFPDLILRARNGDETALGDVLEQHRAYLRILALRTLDGPLAARLDPSDIIQQTFLSAFRNFGKFTGEQAAEFLAWLVQIHERNVQDAVREHVLAQKRSVGSEEPPAALAAVVDVRASNPSQRALQGERAVQLAAALEHLPQEQSEAVRLRHFEGFSLLQIAERLNRSERAAAALLHRGIANLRRRIHTPP